MCSWSVLNAEAFRAGTLKTEQKNKQEKLFTSRIKERNKKRRIFYLVEKK